ncbi:hypothetical protein [Chelatococcus reniformis]|uniref:Uncharacterized protein n=1 Tax=Chelatococcus reniformis TaxID=1494448 RepID=A0A916UN47_9HYPH|nr:hypothetical protein [Chelatococcus reniformis]GGC80068.1 hypothetical protein GCM10010994_42560 [Chelatococcus reniformis]
MPGASDDGETGPPDRPRRGDGFASRRERRLWLIGYGVVFIVVGIGAVRILIRQFS